MTARPVVLRLLHADRRTDIAKLTREFCTFSFRRRQQLIERVTGATGLERGHGLMTLKSVMIASRMTTMHRIIKCQI
jgi:hypothetical protein